MKIGNRKIEFAASRVPLTFNFLPRMAIYASQVAGWERWCFEIAFLFWGIGFKVAKIEDEI